jgi:hypothetical protein
LVLFFRKERLPFLNAKTSRWFIVFSLQAGKVRVAQVGLTSFSERTDGMTINKSLASSSLAEVIDRILDKGVVIDAFVRIALVGIELIAIEVRAVIASVETYLRYAEAVGLTTDAVAAAA